MGQTGKASDADESSPYGGNRDADQEIGGMVAERIAVAAYGTPERSKVTIAGGVKHTCQNREDACDKEHGLNVLLIDGSGTRREGRRLAEKSKHDIKEMAAIEPQNGAAEAVDG